MKYLPKGEDVAFLHWLSCAYVGCRVDVDQFYVHVNMSGYFLGCYRKEADGRLRPVESGAHKLLDEYVKRRALYRVFDDQLDQIQPIPTVATPRGHWPATFPAAAQILEFNLGQVGTLPDAQPEGETSMNEKNAAAMLRADTRTIKVRFDAGDKVYTYVTDLTDLQVNDRVVVPAVGRLAVAIVDKVDDDLLIEPKDSAKYSWVVQKVDMKAYDENMAKNSLIEEELRKGYRAMSRRSFADTMLQHMDPDAAKQLQALLQPRIQS